MRLYRKRCPYCEEYFDTPNLKKYFCSTRCRRDYQTAREREARAEKSDSLSEYLMPDVWTDNPLPESITANALLDGWTSECTPPDDLFICPDEVLGGPLACQQCPHWRCNSKSRRTRQGIDLICDMCRSGVRV